jgi:FkbM family methyltransferase
MPPGNISLRTCYLAPGDIFVDIGCFRGYLSIKASKIVGPNGLVYSFDPIDSSIDILEKQIQINKIGNIRIFASACVSEDCDYHSIPFLDAGDGSTNNSVIPNHLSMQTQSREVPCISPATILSQIPRAHLSYGRIIVSITTN